MQFQEVVWLCGFIVFSQFLAIGVYSFIAPFLGRPGEVMVSTITDYFRGLRLKQHAKEEKPRWTKDPHGDRIVVRLDAPLRGVSGGEVPNWELFTGDRKAWISKENGFLSINGKRYDPSAMSEFPLMGLSTYLVEEIGSSLAMHPNIMDALLENPQLIPEAWKKLGRIMCWGVVTSDNKTCMPLVQYFYWDFSTETWRKGKMAVSKKNDWSTREARTEIAAEYRDFPAALPLEN